MKIAPRNVESFLAAPDPAVRGVLVYGPDTGLVTERADRLVASAAEDPADPFRVASLTSTAVETDPARLADETQAISLTGGRRVVRVRDAKDAVAGPLGEFLDAAGASPDPQGALVIVEAGDLGARSALRRLFEGAPSGAALPCYADEGESLTEFIRSTLAGHGLHVSSDAMTFLAERLGGDRLLTRRELEKLALYAAAQTEVSIEDAAACIGDSAATALEDVAFAAADGDLTELDRALGRLFREGVTPVGLLRAAQRHMLRLHQAGTAVAGGTQPDQAMKRLRPAVFWKHQTRFRRQLRLWPPGRAADAMERLVQAEAACKQTGVPAEALAERTLLSLAGLAARQRRGR